MTDKAIELLRRLIATPSVSRDEGAAANIVEDFLRSHGCDVRRYANNVAALPAAFDPRRPTVLLNSHIDTVKPSPSYTRDPFAPDIEDGILYGLGSNDAGASLVSLMATFISMRDAGLPYNLVFAASAEEEVGGAEGMRLLLPSLRTDGIIPDMAIIGEPTSLQPAYAERGLIVLDCETRGVSGHAARDEGINAIYRAMADIDAMRGCHFDNVSSVLGPIKISITQIQAGRQHNVIPDSCQWVADVRTTDAHTNEETARILAAAVSPHTVATPRSYRVHASVLPETHPLMRAARSLSLAPFVSPTTSDMSLLYLPPENKSIPALKIGPGDSSRSHTADEFIPLSEIPAAISLYRSLLHSLSTRI